MGMGIGGGGSSDENLCWLVADGADASEARVFKFAGANPRAALQHAQRLYRGSEVEVFENGRSLGRISTAPPGDFWVIGPPSSQRAETGIDCPQVTYMAQNT